MEECDEVLIYRRVDADGTTGWFAKLNLKTAVRDQSVGFSETIELKAGLKRRAKAFLAAAVKEREEHYAGR